MEDFPFDDEYVRRLRAADPVIESHFFDYFHGRLLRMLRKSVRPDEAEDLCQRVYQIVFTSLRANKGPDDSAKFPGWVFGIAHNVVNEWYRRPKADSFDPETHVLVSPDDAELRYITKQRVELVRRTIESLDPPPRDREIVTKIFIEEQDREKVGRDYGVDRQYLRVLIHRALMRFKELYPDKE